MLTSIRALSLQGGGALASYEAGVLYGFVKNAKDPEDFQYDVLSGVSAGSMNSMSLGLFAKGDEDTAVEMLSDQWATTTNKDVFQQWEPLGVVTGLLSEGGLLDSTPLLNLLQKKFQMFGGKL